MVRLEDGKVRNFRNDWEDKPTEYYQDLVVTCQMSEGHAEPYGWTISYSDVLRVDIEKADKMSKTLKAINRKYNTVADKVGSPVTFGGHVAYVANALGAKTIVFYKKDGHQGTWYDDCAFIFRTIADGKQEIDILAKDIVAELQPSRLRAV